MKKTEITATQPANESKGIKEDMSATIVVEYPESLDEAKQVYGEEAMLSNAFANWRITLQAGIRRALCSGKTAEQIQAEFATAKMGVSTTGARVDPIQASLALFKTMSKEDRAKYLADLKAAAAAA